MQSKFLLATSAVLTFANLAISTPEPFARPNLAPEPEAGKLELNTEYIRGDELTDLKVVIDKTKQRWAELNLPLPEEDRRRDAHPFGHGCVKAKFAVEKDLPAELRAGAFSFLNETAPEYDAWIRFSNSNEDPKGLPDWVPDGRGMAIKLTKIHSKLPAELKDQRQLTEPEEQADTQDFIMISGSEAFFIDDLTSYNELFTKGPLFFANPKRQIERERAFAMRAKMVKSPLDAVYFSMVPTRYAEPAGPKGKAMKYAAFPCEGQKLPAIPSLEKLEAIYKNPEFFKNPKQFAAQMDPTWTRFLRNNLVAQNSASDSCFEFRVQFQEDANKQRIEHTTDQWGTKFHKVATIRIPKGQPIDTKNRQKFCEGLSLTPWNGVHRPLSAVNWGRRFVYPIISDSRHGEKAGTRRDREPTGEEKI